jgi:ABC-type phosphate/phosphonate transport system permease subunit
MTMRDDAWRERRGWWGAFAGLITAVLVAFPLSTTLAYATHPVAQRLLGGPLENASHVWFATFWWLLTILIASLPFIVGFGIARLSSRGLAVLASIVAVFVIAIVVLGQLYVF